MTLKPPFPTQVLTLGGAVTGTRIYCAYVSEMPDKSRPKVVELTPFTSVVDIVSHSNRDVAIAAQEYKRLWNVNPVIKEIASQNWNEHRTFDRGAHD